MEEMKVNLVETFKRRKKMDFTATDFFYLPSHDLTVGSVFSINIGEKSESESFVANQFTFSLEIVSFNPILTDFLILKRHMRKTLKPYLKLRTVILVASS